MKSTEAESQLSDEDFHHRKLSQTPQAKRGREKGAQPDDAVSAGIRGRRCGLFDSFGSAECDNWRDGSPHKKRAADAVTRIVSQP